MANSNWNPDERRLNVGSNSPSNSNSDRGCRLSRSFNYSERVYFIHPPVIRPASWSIFCALRYSLCSITPISIAKRKKILQSSILELALIRRSSFINFVEMLALMKSSIAVRMKTRSLSPTVYRAGFGNFNTSLCVNLYKSYMIFITGISISE